MSGSPYPVRRSPRLRRISARCAPLSSWSTTTPTSARLAVRVLARMGLAVVGEAGDVAAAAAAAAELRPDAALVDVGLPDGDGIELAQQLVALPWQPRVVLTSSRSGSDDATPPRSRRRGRLPGQGGSGGRLAAAMLAGD